MDRNNLCDEDCNHCPIIGHSNSRMLTYVFNKLEDKFGDGVYKIVQDACPNFTVCFDCRIDDFCHIEGCKIIKKIENEGQEGTKNGKEKY
ncbi:MAG: hypothetical protein PHP92_03865 [Candidatus Nanoarchaeia archaeon]|nr:hypothetical protein [Candidatus Nanoarchaeia archaeon]